MHFECFVERTWSSITLAPLSKKCFDPKVT
ncbi:MAG: hypothetical protein QOJ99_259 [Bryobacterales bacterium]|nr:hypothetical protein [Bryobacterales bacterium]